MGVFFFVVGAVVLLYFGIGGMAAAGALSLLALAGANAGDWSTIDTVLSCLLIAASWLLLMPNQFRRDYLAGPLLAAVRGMLPKLSDTEAEALRSGHVDWDGQLFSGKPRWSVLLQSQYAGLSVEEREFLQGPVNNLCEMVDDWSITNELFDLPENVWAYMREQGFFGLVIPREFGGKGFSQTAHSEIVMKLSTRSVSAAVTAMVPNSLGPGELLMEYGTEDQKAHYLPRLASGQDIPCFALTSPVAGSDAGAIPDKGVVCMGEWQGEQTLGLRVTWNKRYITLAPVATIIGLAIKVYDPERLLGGDEEIGVSCVMIPHDLPGVNSGTRHLPMNTVFMNGPTWGEDVFIPMDQVIGGREMLGRGWTMLLECLSIGRSVSLPALAAGAGKVASLTAGSYSRVREQFGRSINQFEGVQEALEPIAGYTYMMDAARLLTTSMLDRGVRPAVPSAVLKYRNTDLMRVVINHAMDIVAGRGVITGPRNFMARIYQAIPIAITVEGANILTRSLMIFGQGAIRCHPYIAAEIEAANSEDHEQALSDFDGLIFGHLAHTGRNLLRALLLGLSFGMLEPVPARGGIQRHYRQLSRFCAAYALLTDVTLLAIGGGLKARQRLSGRMADCLVHLYYASAVIKFWHEEGYPESQRSIVEWCLQSALHELQEQMREIVVNFPVRALRWPLRLLVFPLGSRSLGKPDDALGAEVALQIVEDTPVRARILQGVYYNDDPKDAIGRVLNAYRLANETQGLRQKLHAAIGSRDPDDIDGIALLMGHQRRELVDWAVDEKIVDEQDREVLLEALNALYDVIRVDAFEPAGIRAMAKCVKGKRKVVER